MRGAISARRGALVVKVPVLPLAGVCAAIGKRRGALAVRLAFAICLAGVLHAAGSSGLGLLARSFSKPALL